jgi:hypothetical protein
MPEHWLLESYDETRHHTVKETAPVFYHVVVSCRQGPFRLLFAHRHILAENEGE